MLKIGSVIDGKYKILNIVGKGGMSTVYLAMNEKANKQWAIKEINATKAYPLFKHIFKVNVSTPKRRIKDAPFLLSPHSNCS